MLMNYKPLINISFFFYSVQLVTLLRTTAAPVDWQAN